MASIRQIHNHLLAGRKLTLEFPSNKEFAAFKATLYTYNRRVITSFTRLGMDCDFAESKFLITKITDTPLTVSIILEKDINKIAEHKKNKESIRQYKILDTDSGESDG